MSDKLREFVEVTQASESDAHTYLSRADGDLEVAIGLFLSEQSATPSGLRTGGASPPGQPTGQTAQKPASNSVSSSSSRSSLHKAPRHRFATFSDLSRQASAPPPSDDPAQFFTGGERSGLAVTNPNSLGPATDAPSLVDEIIRKAQQRGASEDHDDSTPPQTHFSGSGFRLGRSGDATDGVVVEHDEREGDDEDMEVLSRTMYFWRDGFSIDDGPLFRFDDPRNDIYLRAINMGRAPIELLKVNPRQPVDVKLVQKLDEDYKRPKLAPSLDRAGQGQRLGGPSTVDVAEPPAEVQAEPRGLGAEGDAAVQLRLADGSTHRLRFDRQGAVQQLYDFVDRTFPSGRPYVIQTAFPPRRLEDKQQSLESAGVAGAVVVQRFV